MSLEKCDRIWDTKFAKMVDRLSIDSYGTPELQLMETAGIAVSEEILCHDNKNSLVLVLAGQGNNGGDALVAARHLVNKGRQVVTFLVGPNESKMTASSASKLKNLEAIGHKTLTFKPGALLAVKGKLDSGTQIVIIDGVLGVGINGPLRAGVYLQCLKEAQELCPDFVVAVDIPSGANASEWHRQSLPLRAHKTITFGGFKPLHILSPGREICGRVIVKDIGFPKEAVKEAAARLPAALYECDEKALYKANPWDLLSQDASKYDRGHVLVIGGSPGKIGAPLLCGLAALRTGAGWVTVAQPYKASSPGLPLELTYVDFFENGVLKEQETLTFIKERKVSSVVIGPGLMGGVISKTFLKGLKDLVHNKGLLIVVDAGGLHQIIPLLREEPLIPSHFLLTPHPGEWLKLGIEPNFSPTNIPLLQKAKSILKSCGACALYKSATPIFLSPEDHETPKIFSSGSNALAKAGSGDVLAGMIAAHGALSQSAKEASLWGMACLHLAAQYATRTKNRHRLIPQDFIEALPYLQS